MSKTVAAKSKDQITQKEKDQCIAILEELLRVPGNDICADCGAKGSKFATFQMCCLFRCLTIISRSPLGKCKYWSICMH